MTRGRTRFRVREIEVTDPAWQEDQALDMWRRMLTSRFQEAAHRSSKRRRKDEEAPA